MTELYYPGQPGELPLAQALLDSYCGPPEERTLLEEIDYDRLNDAPKLIYRDWLADRSDARADAWDWVVSLGAQARLKKYEEPRYVFRASESFTGRYFLEYPAEKMTLVKSGKLTVHTNVKVLMQRDRRSWLAAILDAVDSYVRHMHELAGAVSRAGTMDMREQPWLTQPSDWANIARLAAEEIAMEVAVEVVGGLEKKARAHPSSPPILPGD